MKECDEIGNYEKPDMFRAKNHGKRLVKRSLLQEKKKKRKDLWHLNNLD